MSEPQFGEGNAIYQILAHADGMPSLLTRHQDRQLQLELIDCLDYYGVSTVDDLVEYSRCAYKGWLAGRYRTWLRRWQREGTVHRYDDSDTWHLSHDNVELECCRRAAEKVQS